MSKKRRRFKTTQHSGKWEGTVSAAVSALQELGEECREVCDNMHENLHGGQRYADLDASASALECLQEPEIPGFPEGFDDSCEWEELGARNLGRGRRRDNAVAALQAVKDRLDAYMDSDPEISETVDDVLAALQQELDTIISDAETCEFPGMYG